MKKVYVHRGPDRRLQSRRESTVKEPVGIIYRRYVIARLYVVLSALTTLIVSIFEPRAINFYYLLNNSIDGKIVIFVSCAIVLAALIDTVVNDFMSDRYKIITLYNKRHLIYMAIAMAMYAQSAAIILTNHDTSLVLVRLWLDGFIAAMVAVLDIFARYGKGVAWQFGK